MEPELTALAGTAGSTLVALMATEAWQRTRDGVVALWRRAHPERAAAVGSELEATRADLVAARASCDTQSEEELQAEWQGRLRRLLAAHPAIAADVRRLLAEVGPSDGPAGSQQEIHMRAAVSGHGRVYQAGRDQHIAES